MVSVTFSPIHLLFPIVEVTGEVAVNEKLGVAGILGIGSVPLTTTRVAASGTSTDTEHLSAWEVGGHVNYYAVGSFEHGMQVGFEVIYMKVAAASTSYHSAASAAGLAMGPYVGYKIITGVGFTFEANLGAEYVALRAESASGTETASDSRWIPLLNLNVGWSF